MGKRWVMVKGNQSLLFSLLILHYVRDGTICFPNLERNPEMLPSTAPSASCARQALRTVPARPSDILSTLFLLSFSTPDHHRLH